VKGRKNGGLYKFCAEVSLLWSGRSCYLASQLYTSRHTIHGDLMEDQGLHLLATLVIGKGCNLEKRHRFPYSRNGTSRTREKNMISVLKH
jgi:hypothetical protein